MVVRAVRWRVLLDALGVHRPLRELTSWYFVGSFFNVILPTGFGGDAVRAAELAQDTSRPARCQQRGGGSLSGDHGAAGDGAGRRDLRPGTASPGIFALTAALFAGGLLAAWLLRRSWWANWRGTMICSGKAVRLLRLPALAEAVAPYDRRSIGRGAGGIAGLQPAADRLERGHRLGTGAATAAEHLLCLRAADRCGPAVAGVRRPGRARAELCRPVWQRRRAPGHRAGPFVGRLHASPSPPGWWAA